VARPTVSSCLTHVPVHPAMTMRETIAGVWFRTEYTVIANGSRPITARPLQSPRSLPVALPSGEPHYHLLMRSGQVSEPFPGQYPVPLTSVPVLTPDRIDSFFKVRLEILSFFWSGGVGVLSFMFGSVPPRMPFAGTVPLLSRMEDSERRRVQNHVAQILARMAGSHANICLARVSVQRRLRKNSLTLGPLWNGA
jgi:hypothetical protein